MSTDKNIQSTKRRKTTPTISLGALPDQLLVAISEYLVVPSRLLLSVALTAPSSSPKWHRDDLKTCHLSRATKGVLMVDDEGESSNAGRWEIIDFGDIPLGKYSHTVWEGGGERKKYEPGLAQKLENDDVFAMLSCIKSTSDNIKMFGLGSLKIDCNGVEPLRGCKTLEQFDFGDSCCEGSIRFLPILESIIDTDGNSLKYFRGEIKVPGKHPLAQRQLEHFFERYDQVLLNRHPVCSGCSEQCDSHVNVYRDHWGWYEPKDITVSQPWTCVECLEHACGLCLHMCNQCEKCSNCVTGKIVDDEDAEENWNGEQFCEECLAGKGYYYNHPILG